MSYIKKEPLLQIAKELQGNDSFGAPLIVRAIENAPEEDVAKIVRCKDCEWWTKQEYSAQGRCALMGIYPTGAWYCGNGRRINNDR